MLPNPTAWIRMRRAAAFASPQQNVPSSLVAFAVAGYHHSCAPACPLTRTCQRRTAGCPVSAAGPKHMTGPPCGLLHHRRIGGPSLISLIGTESSASASPDIRTCPTAPSRPHPSTETCPTCWSLSVFTSRFEIALSSPLHHGGYTAGCFPLNPAAPHYWPVTACTSSFIFCNRPPV